MASPFRLFRKYLKPLLVVFGVMLMFVFVIGDALVGYLGQSRSGRGDATRDARAVAVRWDGGSLTNAELHDLVLRRRILNAFIQGVEFAGRRAAFEAGVEPRSLRVEPIVGPETQQQGVERSVVHTKLFAKAARNAGMRINDETIVRYLDELGRGNVSREDMRNMLSRLQSGAWRVSIDYIIDALREEMLARNYIASHQFAFETVTPEQRWEDWLKVNDRVVVEAAAIPTEQFLIDVPEPSEVELAEFFEAHKNREPQPDFVGQMEFPSATPGFRIPRKIDVQYIQTSYDDYLAKIEDEISDDEVEKYYEENKDLFIKADTGLMDDASMEADEDTASEAESDVSSEEIETSTDTTPNDVDSQPVEEESPATPNEEDQSAHDGVNPFRLAAFLQESDPDAASTAIVEEAVEPADPAAKPEDSAEAASPAESKPDEYQPLDEVRDLIRRELASRQAAEQMNELMNEIAGELNASFTGYFGEMLDAQANENDMPSPPESLTNLAPLAEKHGMAHGATGPVTLLEMRAMPVGKSGNAETGVSLWQTLFLTRDVELYQPIVTVDIDGNRYVVLKTSDTPFRVPELSEVKDEVVRAWKKQKAAEDALKHAEERAKKADEAGTTLADFFGSGSGVEIVRTDPFSHYTGGDVALVGGQFQQQPFRLSEPEGIVAAGPDFLNRVFELKDGEVAAVLNHDQSIAYVIRIVEHQDSPDALRNAYLSEATTWPGLRLMVNSHARIAAVHLINDIASTFNLIWERPNDQPEQEEEAEA